MHYLINYLLFAAKFITVLVALLAAFAIIIAIASKAKGMGKGRLSSKSLNDKLDDMRLEILTQTADEAGLKDFKKEEKAAKKELKHKVKAKLYVIDFYGDIKAQATSALQEQITAIILNYRAGDEVLVRLESGGGLVHAYGLASAQLGRLRDADIPLTVAVDKVAASGGYMMACVANKIIAAPFAIVGSIGVLAQIPNVHRLLEKNDVDFEQFTAGKYKRTVTVFGKNTTEGKEKFQEELEETLHLFKAHIAKYRPIVDCNKVATGEHWFACDTEDKNLVDALQTSDDFILANYPDKEIIELEYKIKQGALQKLANQASLLLSTAFYNQRYGA